MLPAIALVGRPNVGKSTLFNQLTRSRDALVADFAGLTRDRKYGEGRIGDHAFIAIDTGGVSGGGQGIDAEMAAQSLQAVEEADVVLLLVDAKDGVTPVDEELVSLLQFQANLLFNAVFVFKTIEYITDQWDQLFDLGFYP